MAKKVKTAVSNPEDGIRKYVTEVLVTIDGKVVSTPTRDAEMREMGWEAFAMAAKANVFANHMRGNNFPRIIIHDNPTPGEEWEDDIWYLDDDNAVHINTYGLTNLEGTNITEAFENYYTSTKEERAEGNLPEHTYGSVDSTEMNRTGKDGERNPGFGTSGHTGNYEYGKRNEFGPRKQGNTWGHVMQSRLDWADAEHEPDPKKKAIKLKFIHDEQWKLLTQNFTDDWGCGDLIKDLRVRAGKFTTDVSDIGVLQSTYNNYELGNNVPLLMALRILDTNFFRLPEYTQKDFPDETFIDSAYADKLIERCGYGEIYLGIKEAEQKALAKTINFVVDSFLRGEVASADEVPTINSILRIFLGRNSGIKANKAKINSYSLRYQPLGEWLKEINYTTPEICDELVIAVDRLPRKHSSGKVFFAPEMAYKVTADSEPDTAGMFLKKHLNNLGRTMESTANVYKCRKSNIQQILNINFSTSFARMLDKNNPFLLPTDKDGKVKPEVVSALHEANIRGLYGKSKRGKAEVLLTDDQFNDLMASATSPKEFVAGARNEYSVKSGSSGYYSNISTFVTEAVFYNNTLCFPVDESGKAKLECITAYYNKYMRDGVERGTLIAKGGRA